MLWHEMQCYLVEHTRHMPGVRRMISASWYGIRRAYAEVELWIKQVSIVLVLRNKDTDVLAEVNIKKTARTVSFCHVSRFDTPESRLSLTTMITVN